MSTITSVKPSGYSAGVSHSKAAPTHNFRAVFSNPKQRQEFAKFLNVIFLQLDEKKFFTLIDDIMKHAKNDDEIYRELFERIGEAKPGMLKTQMLALRSLSNLKQQMAGQVEKLMGRGKKVDGYMEIGYPGRFVRPFGKVLKMSGLQVVANDKEQASDYIQSGFPRPYHKFIPINDFDAIDKSRLANASVDMVSCLIGLHHTPPHKIKGFLQSIHRIIRPGGTLLIRDHDAKNYDLTKLVTVVHSVFNAATGVTPEEEKKECRNFQPLSHWTALLERNGFKRVSTTPLVVDKDPTLNGMIRFERVSTEEEKRKAKTTKTPWESEPGYKRESLQTYLTAPEWHNVAVAKEYAEFINHTPFYNFPYFQHIAQLWNVFTNSWNAAREEHSFSEVAFSSYTMMNLFISIWTTIEFFFKGIISAPIAWMFNGQEADTIQLLVKDPESKLRGIDARVKVIEKYAKERFNRIQVPRYIPFTEIMCKFAKANVQIEEIAGQKQIQLKARVKVGKADPCKNLTGCRKLYEWPVLTDPKHKFVNLKVDVKHLGKVIRDLKGQGHEICYVHDF